MAKMCFDACPVCGSPAQYRLIDHKNRKHRTCNTCGEYSISRAAERRVVAQPKESREQLSVKLAQGDHLRIWDIQLSHGEPFVGVEMIRRERAELRI